MMKYDKMSKQALIREIYKLQKEKREHRKTIIAISELFRRRKSYLLMAEHFGFDFAEWTAYDENRGVSYEDQLREAFDDLKLAFGVNEE